jgi:triosephosphate isomerase
MASTTTRGRDVIKIYKIGRGKDAKREKLTAVQRQARHREKQKAMELSRILMGGSYAQHAV